MGEAVGVVVPVMVALATIPEGVGVAVGVIVPVINALAATATGSSGLAVAMADGVANDGVGATSTMGVMARNRSSSGVNVAVISLRAATSGGLVSSAVPLPARASWIPAVALSSTKAASGAVSGALSTLDSSGAEKDCISAGAAGAAAASG